MEFFTQHLIGSFFIDKNIDAIKSVMICDGTTASAGIDDDSAYHLSDESLKNHMENFQTLSL